jgi:cytochrome c biogenesis protein
MKSIWKFFASIRFSVVLLLVIAGASVTGTVIPQNESVQIYVAKFGVAGYRILATLDMFDVYASWWFQALLFLLVINIVVCSIDRLPTTLKAVYSKRLSRNPAMYRNLMRKETFDTPLSPEALGGACEKLVTGGDGPQQTPEGFYTIGEKGRWTRFGVYGVHLSIVLLVVGAIIGSLFGFDGYAKIVEGESVSAVRLGNNGAVQKLEFELRCDDFDISFYPTGTPKEYRSTLTVLEQGEPTIQKDILVNSPLRYKGINIFQSGYDLLYVELTFKSRETGTEYRKQVAMGASVELPEDIGTFVLNGFQGAMDYKGQDIGPVFYGHLIPKEGEVQSILLPVEIPELDAQRKGDVSISVSGTLYYTGLQVTKDPGVWVVYAGFIILIVGCFVTFFTSHQRLFIEVVKQKEGCRVTVAGIANKNKFGMQQEVKRVAERLSALPEK